MSDSLFPPLAPNPAVMPMPSATRAPQSLASRLFPLALVLALTTVVLRGVMAFPQIFKTVIGGDNDDIMRLMQIRAWLGGQGWFDMTQYRVLPPEGISLHWSRYVDLGIAAILVPLSKVFPASVAENLTLVIWPTLLLALMVVIAGYGTRKHLGDGAAIAAMVGVVQWALLSQLYFGPGRIDHHNVQMLTTTIMAYAMIARGRPLLHGAIAGAAAAFSLAVGLETLPLILVAGALLLLRSAWEREAANTLLTGFCLALFGAELVLFLGQTGPDEWLVPRCDKLASPVLALSAIAAIACLAPIALRRWLANPWARLGASGVLVGMGVKLCAGLLAPCLAGPYGSLPPDVQKIIANQILEAMPGLAFAGRTPFAYNSMMTPVVASILLGALFLAIRRKAPAAEKAAVGQMLVLGCVGLLGSFYQIRMNLLSTCAVPFLIGYVLRCLWEKRAEHRKALWSLALVGGVAVTEFAQPLNIPARAAVHAFLPPERAKALTQSASLEECRDPADLSALDALPKARILTPMDLATPMIATTHHDGLAAPYHRSAAAYANGIVPFRSSEGMVAALRSTGATYVAICGGSDASRSPTLTAQLLRGEVLPYLQPVAVAGTALKVFKVLPDILAEQP